MAKKKFYTSEEIVAFRLGSGEFLKVMSYRYPGKTREEILKEYYKMKWYKKLGELPELKRKICSNCEHWVNPEYNQEEDIYQATCNIRKIICENETPACEFFKLKINQTEDLLDRVKGILQSIKELKEDRH